MNDLAALLSREMGKDIQRAGGEVNGTILGGPYMAQAAGAALKTRDFGGGTQIQYRPLGVAAQEMHHGLVPSRVVLDFTVQQMDTGSLPRFV